MNLSERLIIKLDETDPKYSRKIQNRLGLSRKEKNLWRKQDSEFVSRINRLADDARARRGY